jgi:uncharacterized protein (TIGR04255 family)
VQPEVDAKHIKENMGEVSGQYDEVRALVQHVHTLNVSDQQPEKNSHISKIDGYKLSGLNNECTVQIRSSGMVVSKQAPYDSWEEFKTRAMEIWAACSPVYAEAKVARVSVRYVNKICLPINEGYLKFEEYLTNVPQVPKGMGQALSRFFNRVEFPLVDIKGLAIVAQVSQAEENGFLPVILDIDVMKPLDHFLDFHSEEIWDQLDDLRNKKNEAFVGSITAKTEALFK